MLSNKILLKINQEAFISETFKQAIVQLLMPRISNKWRPVQNLFLRTNFLLFMNVTDLHSIRLYVDVFAISLVNTRMQAGFPVISTFGISLVLRPKEFYWVSVCKTQSSQLLGIDQPNTHLLSAVCVFKTLFLLVVYNHKECQ